MQTALRAGLGTSFALLVAGILIAAFEPGSGRGPVPLSDLFGRLPLGSRLMGLGILVLGLTPVIRVLLLVFLWIRERDYRHAAVAGVVLITLITSVVLGHPG